MLHPTNTFSWRNEPELMARLTTAQNALRAPVDIMTFAGMCDSREQLEAHVLRYEQIVCEQAPKRRAKPQRGVRCTNTRHLDAIMGW